MEICREPHWRNAIGRLCLSLGNDHSWIGDDHFWRVVIRQKQQHGDCPFRLWHHRFMLSQIHREAWPRESGSENCHALDFDARRDRGGLDSFDRNAGHFRSAVGSVASSDRNFSAFNCVVATKRKEEAS